MTVETKVRITAEDRASEALARVQSAAEKLDAPFLRITNTLGALAGGTIATGIFGLGAAMLRAADDAEQATRRMDVVLKATGNVTGYTRQQLDLMADSLASASKFDDEAFRSATANILRFGNVAGENLARTLKASADLAAFLGTDLPAATDTLARAIASPAQGIERLQRTIGYLDEVQIQAIKSMDEMGDRAGAQAKILEMLEKKIGGADDALNSGVTGAFGRLKKSISELLELGGTVASSPLANAMDGITGRLKGLKTLMEGDWTLKLAFAMNVLSGGMTGPSLDDFGRVKPRAPGAPTDPGPTHLPGPMDSHIKAEEAFQKKLHELRKKWADEESKRRFESAKAELQAEEMFGRDYVEAWKWVYHYQTKDSDAAKKLLEEQTDAYIKSEEMAADDLREAWKWYAHYKNKELAGNEQDWSGMIGGIESGWREMWAGVMDGTINSFGDAMDSLKNVFMRTLTDLAYQAYMKPIMLNIVGGIGQSMGMNGITSAASNALGGGQTAGFGNLANMFGGGSGFSMSGIMSSMGSNPIGWMLAMSAASGAIGNRLFSGNRAAQTASNFGLGVGALVNLLTGGSKENQNFRFSQGMGGEGLFGGLGVDGTYNFDLTKLRGATGGFDTRILALLGGNQQAGTDALAAYTAAGRRSDGQPAQFAFPEGDETAAEQIAKELLQSRYGTLFGLIDKSFAEQIKSFTGTSTELQAFIDATLGLFEQINQLGIKGLNVDSLRALAGPNGDLAQTATSIAQNLAGLTDAFTTESDKFAAAQLNINNSFAALGIAAPQSNAEFLKLVQSIDFSTEAGRNLYNTLVQVAPSFQMMSAAADAMARRFQAAMASIFGSSVARASLENQSLPLISQFQSLTGLLGGMNPLDIFRSLGGAQSGDLQWIFDNFGPEVDALLTQILELYAQYINLSDVTEEVTGGLGNLGGVINNTVDLLGQAKANLKQYLVGSLLNEQLSPLSVQQRFGVAQSEYNRILGLAQGNNVDAINQLGGARDVMLELARQLFGGSQDYISLFSRSFEQTRGVAGGGPTWQSAFQAALPPSGQTMATEATMQEVAATLQRIFKATVEGAEGQAGAVEAAATRTVTELRLSSGKLVE